MPKCLRINEPLLEITDVVRNLGTFTQELDVNGDRLGGFGGEVVLEYQKTIITSEAFARFLCQHLGQQAVMLEITDSNVQFISAQ